MQIPQNLKATYQVAFLLVINLIFFLVGLL